MAHQCIAPPHEPRVERADRAIDDRGRFLVRIAFGHHQQHGLALLVGQQAQRAIDIADRCGFLLPSAGADRRASLFGDKGLAAPFACPCSSIHMLGIIVYIQLSSRVPGCHWARLPSARTIAAKHKSSPSAG